MPHLAQFNHDRIRMRIKRIRDNNDPFFLRHRALLIRAIFLPRARDMSSLLCPNATGLLTKKERDRVHAFARSGVGDARGYPTRDLPGISYMGGVALMVRHCFV